MTYQELGFFEGQARQSGGGDYRGYSFGANSDSRQEWAFTNENTDFTFDERKEYYGYNGSMVDFYKKKNEKGYVWIDEVLNDKRYKMTKYLNGKFDSSMDGFLVVSSKYYFATNSADYAIDMNYELGTGNRTGENPNKEQSKWNKLSKDFDDLKKWYYSQEDATWIGKNIGFSEVGRYVYITGDYFFEFVTKIGQLQLNTGYDIMQEQINNNPYLSPEQKAYYNALNEMQKQKNSNSRFQH
ncbi:MAG: hypothetical protein CVU09_01565 [Bacteroidetes bacterium HGW-Bacteroidetes-4]|jgi:hypothetical protein|nr:MAG: hypothetical protein CVU09_01565 [Bacteroidetes bacterium HGW-Bacteroidetes-4]